jgi:hypothetical protein
LTVADGKFSHHRAGIAAMELARARSRNIRPGEIRLSYAIIARSRGPGLSDRPSLSRASSTKEKQMTTFTHLGAVLAFGTIMFAAFESAPAAPDKPRHSSIRDHRRTGGAPSGGIRVDGRKVDMKPPKLCHGGLPCPPSARRPPPRPKPVVRDHR